MPLEMAIHGQTCTDVLRSPLCDPLTQTTVSTMVTATATCLLQVKLLNSDMVLVEKVPLDETVDQLYARIAQIETATQQWKLLLITTSPRTMRLANDCQKTLQDYGVEANMQYRLEVILASFNLF